MLGVCGLGFAAAFFLQARGLPAGTPTYFPSGGPYDPRIKVLVLALAAACVLVVRRWTAVRDPVIAVVGVGFAFYVTNWEFVVTALVVGIAIHRWARRLPSGIAMVATAGVMFAAFMVFVPKTGNAAVNGGLAWASLRMGYYAFESKAIKKRNRSLWSLFAYAPFTVLLWPGDPPMLSYLTYTSPRPRAFLDALGGRALYRSVVKLHLFLLYDLVLRTWIDGGTDTLHFGAQLIRPYIVLYLMLSASADLCTGVSNLAGYYAPDAFDKPFLSMTPIHLWFRWNVHVLGFLRQAVILPIARRRRSLGLIVLAGLLASSLLHICARPPIWNYIYWRGLPANVLVTLAFFLASVPIYLRIDRWPRSAQIASTVVTQCALVVYYRYCPVF